MGGFAIAPQTTETDVATPPRLSTRQAARRQHLLDAALALLEERDYERISVREVAEAAGVALATLYHYFPSKDSLFAEALVQWASTLGTDVTRRPLAGTTPAQRLEAALLRAARAFERRPQLARLLNRFEISDEPAAHDVLVRLDSTTSDVYLDLLHDMPRDEALLVVHVLDAVFDGALRGWSVGRWSAADMRRRISDGVGVLLGSRYSSGASTK
jgi:TetR/AcrR family transcriptional regulator, cholesterol catabolism regulator